jgi:hypothetical protein
LARVRYPQEQKDLKSYKDIVWEYGGKKDLYGNIDLLFFCQWPKSKMANVKIYQKLKNHHEIVLIFKECFGDEEAIKHSAQRYQKREALVSLIKKRGQLGLMKEIFLNTLSYSLTTKFFTKSYDVKPCITPTFCCSIPHTKRDRAR